jgi:hypothetical protein
MQLKLVRSGGLAGLDMVAALDTADLPVDQQDVVDTLLTADLQSPHVNRPGGADQFSYQLEIHHGDRTVRHHWQEPDVPETVRPLLAELTRRAKPAR